METQYVSTYHINEVVAIAQQRPMDEVAGSSLPQTRKRGDVAFNKWAADKTWQQILGEINNIKSERAEYVKQMSDAKLAYEASQHLERAIQSFKELRATYSLLSGVPIDSLKSLEKQNGFNSDELWNKSHGVFESIWK